MSGLISINESGKSFKGKNDRDIASAVANALVTYVISTPSLITFTLSGTVGPVGSVTGVKVSGISGQLMATAMITKANSLRLSGKNMIQFFQAISAGVATHLKVMQVTGTASGIAVGTGTGRFTKIAKPAVKSLLNINFLGKQIRGKNAKDIIESIAYGFTQHMKSVPTVTAIVAGAISPTPPTGPIPITGIPTIYNKIA